MGIALKILKGLTRRRKPAPFFAVGHRESIGLCGHKAAALRQSFFSFGAHDDNAGSKVGTEEVSRDKRGSRKKKRGEGERRNLIIFNIIGCLVKSLACSRSSVEPAATWMWL